MSVIKLFRLGIAMFSVFCTPTKTARLSRGCLETRLRSDIRELKQLTKTATATATKTSLK